MLPSAGAEQRWRYAIFNAAPDTYSYLLSESLVLTPYNQATTLTLAPHRS